MHRKRRTALILAGLAILLGGLWFGFDYASHPRLITGPMVQMPASTSFTVIWRMHPARPARLVVLRPDGSEVCSVPAQADGDQWLATAEGLQPAGEYVYRIVCDLPSGRSETLCEKRTRTAPPPGETFRFMAFGDSGDGSWTQRSLARLMPGYEPDLIIHTGDLVYSIGAVEDYPKRFYEPYAELLAGVPFCPTLGNHDIRTASGQPYLDAFVLPRNGPSAGVPEREYWFDFGAARFVALDTNRDAHEIAATTVPWLEEVLSSADDRWKIVYFHEPVYTHGSKYPPAAKLLATVAPLFDTYGVQLALAGHNHMYERTRPIRNGRVAPGGTVYVTTGAGGAHLYSELPNPPAYMAAAISSQHSFTIADVASHLITLRQIGRDGTLIDESFIERPAIPTSSRPAVSQATASRPTSGATTASQPML